MTGTPEFVLTGFADEISPDLDSQLATLEELEIRGLDLRSAYGVNVADMDDELLDEIDRKVHASGIKVQCIGSPVNKVPLDQGLREAELGKLERSIHAAHRLGTRRIRVFSPEVPQDQLESLWPDVREWMAEQVHLAEKHDMVLIHENDARFYGAYPEGAKRLLAEFSGTHFKAVFDFANTVLIGYRAMEDWFPWLLPHLDTLHIKDAVQAEGKVVPAGEGDGQVRQTLAWLIEQGWHGPLTLEPHLQAAGMFGGFSGPQLFEVAAKAIRKVLGEVGGRA